MTEQGRLWALHDTSPSGATVTNDPEAAQREGYGIFWMPNVTEGRRVKANLREIRYWFVDLDSGSKDEQVAKLKQAPLLPSLVVESKRGYHAYWRASDATLENWRKIETALCDWLDGDRRATDVTRLLRAPGFLHLKDPASPFLVAEVWRMSSTYSEAQMLRAFRPDKAAAPRQPQAKTGEGFWWDVARLPAKASLEALSGHWLIDEEVVSVRPTSAGKSNIYIQVGTQERSTPCWVTAEDTLAGVEGGTSIAAWCYWYQRPRFDADAPAWCRVKEGLLEVFPELLEIFPERLGGEQK